MSETLDGEEVVVIAPWPHPWWEREEIQPGVLVRHADEERVYRVRSKWAEGVSLEAVTGGPLTPTGAW